MLSFQHGTILKQLCLHAASPGGDVWSTFSTSRDTPAAAPDAFGSSDPFESSFGSTGATPAASQDPFGTAPASGPAPASSSSDPFGSLSSDPFGAPAPPKPQTLGSSRAAQSSASTASADPFGMPGLATSSNKPSTPTARALPEDMFAAPATATGFSMSGFGAPQQMQQPGGAFGQPGGMGGAPRGPFPGMQPGGGAFGMPQQAQNAFGMPQQAQNAFGGQQGGFGMPGSFGGQQRGAGQQQSGFGGSDPFASGTGSSDPFGASSSTFTQVIANILLLHSLYGAL